MINALADKEFLKKLDLYKKKDVYAKIISLDINENPIEQIEGKITGGSINIDGASAVRRTCSLTIVAQEVNIDDYYWGLSNKFTVSIGIENFIDDRYPDIIWFDQGIFVITSFNSQYNTSNYTISITGQDKMCLLNGTVAGALPTTIDFKQSEFYTVSYSPYNFGTIYEKGKYYVINNGTYSLNTEDYDETQYYYTKDYNEYRKIIISENEFIPYRYYELNNPYTEAPNKYIKLKNYYKLDKDTFSYKRVIISEDEFNKNEALDKDKKEIYYIENTFRKITEDDIYDEFEQYYIQKGENINRYYPIELNATEFAEQKTSLYVDNRYILSQDIFMDDSKIYYEKIQPRTYSLVKNLNEYRFAMEKDKYYIFIPDISIEPTVSQDEYNPSNKYFEKKIKQDEETEEITYYYSRVYFDEKIDAYEAYSMYYIYDEISDSFKLSTDDYSPNTQYYVKNVIRDVNDIPVDVIVREAVHFYGQEPYHNIVINDIDKYGLELMEYRGEEPMFVLIKDGTVENVVSSGSSVVCNPLDVDIITFNQHKSIMEGELLGLSRIKEQGGSIQGEQITDENIGFYEEKIKENFLNKVCEINATTAKFRECSLDDADSIIYNTLLNEYNRQPTAVLLEGDKDYTPYTIAKIEYGDAAGYKITPLTIPDGMDLIGQPGEPLTSILDKIKNIFSNFEYFYDIDGRFIFQKKQDYLTTSWNNIIRIEDETFVDNTRMRTKSSYDFQNNELITSITNTPKLDNVKNDFSVQGQMTTITGAQVPIFGRLALDEKPKKYMSFPIRHDNYETNEDGSKQIKSSTLITEYLLDGQVQCLVQHRYYSYESDEYKAYVELKKDAQETLTAYENGEADYLSDEEIYNIQNTLSEQPSYYEIKPIYYQGVMYGGIHYIDYYCDYREVIYQMAKDYYAHNQEDDYMAKLREFNPDTCADGTTGYERYYVEIYSFWRDTYNTEPEITYSHTGGKMTTWNEYDPAFGVVKKTGWKDVELNYSEPLCDFYLPTYMKDEFLTNALSYQEKINNQYQELLEYNTRISGYVDKETEQQKSFEAELELKAQDKEEVIKRRDNDENILALKADVSRLSELSQNAANSKNTELAQIKTDVEEALKNFGFSTISNVSNFIETSTALNNTINDIQAIDDTKEISEQYATQQLKEYSQKYEETLKTLQSTELDLTPEHREMLEKHLQILEETIAILKASLKGGE